MRILFLNPQGNFDANDSYLTQHPDFGGQLVYVKETAKAMTKMGHQVDIITRQIIDDDWKGFEEMIDYYPDTKDLRIIRIPFGGEKFLRKEDLWLHLNEFVDKIDGFYQKEGTKIDFITSHYGDGGISAVLLSRKLNIPFSFTGHSLGAQKMDKLNINSENIDEINEKYNFNIRIAAERQSMMYSAVNIVSTSQERFGQYSHKAYCDIVDVEDDNKFSVIPPGVNTTIFNEDSKCNDMQTIKLIKQTFERDIKKDRLNKPFIVASSRLEAKKNHVGIIKAYAYDKKVQDDVNLVFVIRGLENPFKSYENMAEEEKSIINTLMEYIQEYDLKGKVSFVDIRSQKQLATLYRYLSSKKSVFCLSALYEPFGLAPIEAMACGLPAVVTKNGGPMEIFIENNERFGILIDPEDHIDIARGFKEIFSDWKFFHDQAVKRVLSKYTWENTAKNYIRVLEEKVAQYNKALNEEKMKSVIDFTCEIPIEKLPNFVNYTFA